MSCIIMDVRTVHTHSCGCAGGTDLMPLVAPNQRNEESPKRCPRPKQKGSNLVRKRILYPNEKPRLIVQGVLLVPQRFLLPP